MTAPRGGDDARADPTLALAAGIGAGTLPAQIHERLEDAIIRGVLEPGQRLHTDRLAARSGVSRIPVREALRSLHEAGWVEIRPRYGVYVRERSEVELHELFEARSVIEEAIAGWAAQRRTAGQLRTLRRVVADSEEAARDGDTDVLDRLGGQFSAAVRDAAGNAVLGAVSAGLEKRARFYFGTVSGELGGDWVAVHHELAELIGAGDAEGAGAVARQHVLDTGKAVAALLAPAGHPVPGPG
jgi:DNA-binding GntR family transcriptional regulator